MQWAALAAVVAALAVGVWVGRNVLPVGGVQSPEHIAGNTTQDLVSAAYVRDPRYLKDRADLVRSLEQKMKTLPPETQAKVTSSLVTIRKSIADIQDALGRDPGNALLQELLVNTYQDEMRVLTTVHEVGDAGQEI
jgi:N-acyl-D-aspartate/D-glutamate deacylase